MQKNLSFQEKYNDPGFAEQVAEKMLQEGYVELSDFFKEDTFKRLCDFGVELGFDDKRVNYDTQTYPMEVARSPELMAFLDRIHLRKCELCKEEYSPLDAEQQVIGFPTMNSSNYNKPNPFHFDASHLNAVLALRINSAPEEGNLLLYPNLRRFLGSRFLGTVLARLLRHAPFLQGIFRPKSVVYKERALYLFFGDVTFHSVAPISTGERLVMVFNNSRILRNR